jgi:pimeloyl-ACP methyl ester carboxylesterase
MPECPVLEWPRETVRLDRVTLAARHAPSTAADPEPAVMLHGLGGSSLNWTDLMWELRDRLDSRAPDLPGHGHSPPPDDGDYSVEGHARSAICFIEDVVDHSGRPVHLFGNSLGGAIATKVSALRPDLVATLTLIAPALPDLRLRRWSAQVGLVGLPGLGTVIAKQLRRLTPEQRVEGLLELCFGDPSLVPISQRLLAAQEIVRRTRLPYADDALIRSTRGVLSAYLERGSKNLWRDAAKVKAPTLVVYGTRDRLVSARGAVRAREAFTDVRVVVLPRVGHVAQIEQPEVVANLFVELSERARHDR